MLTLDFKKIMKNIISKKNSIMNKANKLLGIFSVLAIMVFISSCVNDDDYNTPNTSIQAPNLIGNSTSFSAVIARYLDAVADGDIVGVFDENDIDLYIEGYVISSDQGGNFFEELIIQNKIDDSDSTQDPRLGLKVEVNVSSLYNTYEVGRKIYIRLNGLAVGESNGVYALGKAVGNSLEQIQAFEYKDFIMRDPEVFTLTPKVAAIGDLTEQDENTLIQLDNMQINRNELVKTFAGEPDDEFDGFRTLEDCDTNATILLQTSTFADFKSLPVPQLKGSINGIFSRDFRDDFNVFVINSAADIIFDSTDRCDPADFIIDSPVDCDDTAVNGATSLFSEDFETFNDSGDIVDAGWTLINLNGGSYNWGIDDFSSNTYAIGNAFGTDEDIDAWLISPEINFDGTFEDVLNFDVQTNFDGGEVLSVWVSTNFVDLEIDSNWSLLQDVDIPSGPSNGFGSFAPAGPINTSCIDGSSVRIAFRYTGSDPGITTRYHVDNVDITGN